MKPTYEEQIRAIGNGKLLQPGCYDENLNLLSEDYRDTSGLKDNVAYVIIPEGVTDIKECCYSGNCYGNQIVCIC